MRTILLITLFTTGMYGYLSGQEVVSPAGDHQSIQDYEVSWTLGEPVIATGTAGEISLTQGMHQAKITVTRIENDAVHSRFHVFPNPAQEFVIIQNRDPEKELNYSLYTVSGERILEGRFRGEQTRIKLEGRVSGTYLLKLKGEGDEPPESFRIIKR